VFEAVCVCVCVCGGCSETQLGSVKTRFNRATPQPIKPATSNPQTPNPPAGKYGRWRFDKRTYATKPPPRHLGDPPKGMKNDMVRRLIASINEATANIPCWDEYARSGAAPRPCGEQIGAQADGFRY